MNVEEMGCEGLDRIYLDQCRGKWWDLVNTVTNL